MAKIRTYNSIAPEGLKILTDRGHVVGPDVDAPEGILVRSAKLHDVELPSTVRAIARAGAGVNNIPLERCTDAGIVVFNTPGSNANSVKELVVAGLLLSSRKILDGCTWVQQLDPASIDVAKEVESGKSAFAGPELLGKKLGVVGLGAIGVMVANAGVSLGMEVVGHDPYLSVDSAWGLSRSVRRAATLDSLMAEVDYVTVHVPLSDTTRRMIGKELLLRAQPGLRVLNFSRDALVDDDAILAAIESGQVHSYVTDFPTGKLLGKPGVIAIPHLGASTPEAETNSAIMAARELADFLEHGNIHHSVNFPECIMERNGGDRIILANRNIPNMVGQVTTVLAEAGLNISDMLNRHRNDVAYNIIDVDDAVPTEVAAQLRAIEGVVMVRIISTPEGS
jgi:D-3-phosphoglycerate dehydrogenase